MKQGFTALIDQEVIKYIKLERMKENRSESFIVNKILKDHYTNDVRRYTKMGQIVAKNAVKRKPGYLYYIDGKGNACEAKMARGGKKKKR